MHMVSRIATFTTGAVMTAVAGYELAYKPWRQRWLASAEESATSLPGDELVPDADFAQTMAVTIEAPPSQVWPWLLQMGYGRAGWYSYDAIDMLGHSARQIVPELQGLEVGQRVPVAPDIGFQVAVLEPERALVLYGDDELFGGQEPAEREGAGGRHADGETAGMRLAGVLSQASMREFRVSWAFALEPRRRPYASPRAVPHPVDAGAGGRARPADHRSRAFPHDAQADAGDQGARRDALARCTFAALGPGLIS
jgi:hypothetical protein